MKRTVIVSLAIICIMLFCNGISVVAAEYNYCPYCGNKMYPIQDDVTFTVTGYCCICEGARNEIEYENKKQILEEKHKKELLALSNEYQDKLTFDSDKLFKIKQRKEKESFEFFSRKYNHFSTLNGEIYTDIEQIVR